jgi:hypothetical protein
VLEVRTLSSGERPPKGVNCVHVTATPRGWFAAGTMVALCSPRPLGTIQEAIKQAVKWAAENNVYVVYVSEG